MRPHDILSRTFHKRFKLSVIEQFGTNDGLVRLDADGQHTYTTDDGLTGIVYALSLDDAGDLWAAGNGLSRYDRENDRWIGYRAHDEQAHNCVIGPAL